MFPSFFNLAMLSMEAQQVIWLRTMKLAAGGPAAQQEATRMVAEKVAAGIKASAQIATGASADKVIRGYRSKTRANLRRLKP
jgi:hypothetical protein